METKDCYVLVFKDESGIADEQESFYTELEATKEFEKVVRKYVESGEKFDNIILVVGGDHIIKQVYYDDKTIE